MKIASVSQAIQVLQEVQARKEGDGDSGGGGGHGGGRKRDERESKESESESEFEKALAAASVKDGQVSQAVEKFGHEAIAQANGITATAVGKGPGLRVVLKDAGGRVLRQYSGEEFLKLREAAADDTRGRGKILDQKF